MDDDLLPVYQFSLSSAISVITLVIAPLVQETVLPSKKCPKLAEAASLFLQIGCNACFIEFYHRCSLFTSSELGGVQLKSKVQSQFAMELLALAFGELSNLTCRSSRCAIVLVTFAYYQFRVMYLGAAAAADIVALAQDCCHVLFFIYVVVHSFNAGRPQMPYRPGLKLVVGKSRSSQDLMKCGSIKTKAVLNNLASGRGKSSIKHQNSSLDQ